VTALELLSRTIENMTIDATHILGMFG